ncbi:hypothetical protein ILUMI_27337 [Ignelater luminosus]|uniref:DUF4371 domain-containing protein n=1 Tax=Ignelater luminosus TaxID=2038154 RepID=A0A8K0FY97_IGNLU|nr:hypothetical protein ILUMI_27337 [Ignelater luminosus]
MKKQGQTSLFDSVKRQKTRNVSETGTENEACTSTDNVMKEEEKLQQNQNDVGLYIPMKIIPDDVKYKLLTAPWIPDVAYAFPAEKRNLKFQPNWIKKYLWFLYTEFEICKCCVIFKPELADKGSHQILEKTTPDIRNILDSTREKQIKENRQRLIPIIETIKLCGRQELSLRGTNDHGNLDLNSKEHRTNDGNFRALLRMRASCGNNVLISHLATAPANALHIIDETSDISRMEQMSLCIRYITEDEDRHIVKEDFLSFMDVEQTTGVYLSNTILEALEKLNINIKFLIGQGYDGTATMRRSYKEVQKLITDKQPQALFVHCCAHSLNFSICHSCDVQSIRNTIGNIKAICAFLKASSKRTRLLRNKIKEAFPDKKYFNLIAFCETRWVENHNAILRFWEL